MVAGIVVVALAIIVLILWALATAVGAAFFAWAWNLLMPALWHAAPVLGFWQGVAAVVLLQFLAGVFKTVTTVQQEKS